MNISNLSPGCVARVRGLWPSGESQRGCGRMPQPRWGWLTHGAEAQGSSLLATLGFVAQSLWDWKMRVRFSGEGRTPLRLGSIVLALAVLPIFSGCSGKASAV